MGTPVEALTFNVCEQDLCSQWTKAEFCERSTMYIWIWNFCLYVKNFWSCTWIGEAVSGSRCAYNGFRDNPGTPNMHGMEMDCKRADVRRGRIFTVRQLLLEDVCKHCSFCLSAPRLCHPNHIALEQVSICGLYEMLVSPVHWHPCTIDVLECIFL